jgi:hypothetical protein
MRPGTRNRARQTRGHALLELMALSAILLILALMRLMSPWTTAKGSGPDGLRPRSGPPTQSSATASRPLPICSRSAHLPPATRPATARGEKGPAVCTALCAAPRKCNCGVGTRADTRSPCCSSATTITQRRRTLMASQSDRRPPFGCSPTRDKICSAAPDHGSAAPARFAVLCTAVSDFCRQVFVSLL